jgi:hypothetical protein
MLSVLGSKGLENMFFLCLCSFLFPSTHVDFLITGKRKLASYFLDRPAWKNEKDELTT